MLSEYLRESIGCIEFVYLGGNLSGTYVTAHLTGAEDRAGDYLMVATDAQYLRQLYKYHWPANAAEKMSVVRVSKDELEAIAGQERYKGLGILLDPSGREYASDVDHRWIKAFDGRSWDLWWDEFSTQVQAESQRL